MMSSTIRAEPQVISLFVCDYVRVLDGGFIYVPETEVVPRIAYEYVVSEDGQFFLDRAFDVLFDETLKTWRVDN